MDPLTEMRRARNGRGSLGTASGGSPVTASRGVLAVALVSAVVAVAAGPVASPARAASPKMVPQSVDRTTMSPSASALGNSAWNEPLLNDPTTVPINNQNRNLVLDQKKDYILECQPGPVRLTWSLVVWGGHNVVFEDCDIDVTIEDWSAAFKDQTGTLWIHDVHFGGRHLHGGIQLQEPAATVVMRDILFDRVYGSYTTDHAECVQTWAGPVRLLVDGLTCPTTYQGLFLLPNQWDSGPAPTVFDLRHVDIDAPQGGYALWLGDVKGGLSAMRLNLEDVYVVPNRDKVWRGWWLWPKPPSRTWGRVAAGSPSGRHFVRATPTGATGVDEGASPPLIAHELW
jgi:hypothetical protein